MPLPSSDRREPDEQVMAGQPLRPRVAARRQSTARAPPAFVVAVILAAAYALLPTLRRPATTHVRSEKAFQG